MGKRIKTAFLLIVLAQGLHSIEEYLGRLREVFPPARYLANLFSSDLKTGFLIINVGYLLQVSSPGSFLSGRTIPFRSD